MRNTLKNITTIGAIAIIASCASANKSDNRKPLEEEAFCGAISHDIAKSVARVRHLLAKLKLWKDLGDSLHLDEKRYREGERSILTQADYEIDKLIAANQQIAKCNPKKNHEVGAIIQTARETLRTQKIPTAKTQPIRQATNRN